MSDRKSYGTYRQTLYPPFTFVCNRSIAGDLGRRSTSSQENTGTIAVARGLRLLAVSVRSRPYDDGREGGTPLPLPLVWKPIWRLGFSGAVISLRTASNNVPMFLL